MSEDTANSRAYAAIRDMLVSVEIPPGAMLNESELSDRLGLGRASIRDALRRLAQDRLLVVHPRRGTFAAEIRISDARWLADVRIPLEGVAARLAARRRSAEDLRTIDNFMTRLDQLGDPHDDTDVDREIHRHIYQMSGNPHLEATLNQYLNLGLRIWYYCLDRLPAVEPHVGAQRRILQAIVDGDADSAERLASQHIRDFLLDVQEHL